MKHCLVTLAALTLAASSFAQGTVNFVNKITGSVDAKVIYAGAGAIGGGATADTSFVAQLYLGTTPVGDPIPFRPAGTGQGYWPGQTRTLPGVAENATATGVKVVAWSTKSGASYEAAKAAGGLYGESPVFNAATGGGLNPPAALTGLQSFIIVPEPSIAALGLLGAGLLLIRRKK